MYIGPAGSWTPLHHDVFRSYSWSVNITGRKQWIFFHPDEVLGSHCLESHAPELIPASAVGMDAEGPVRPPRYCRCDG